jgi:hypothetical protein
MVYAVVSVVGVLTAVVGAGYGIFGEGGRIGPGFLPVDTGTVTAVLCAAIAGGIVRRAVRHEPEAAVEEVRDVDITGRSERQRVINLWLVFGLTFVAIMLVQVVGFLAAFGLLVLVISAAVERQPIIRSAVITLAAVVLVYVVFGLFLGVPLPGGVLGLGTEG